MRNESGLKIWGGGTRKGHRGKERQTFSHLQNLESNIYMHVYVYVHIGMCMARKQRTNREDEGNQQKGVRNNKVW